MTYSPKYVSLDDVPVRQVPDDYDQSEKEDAIETAETSIELDTYDGMTIPVGTLGDAARNAVVAAVKQKATCELVKGAEDPTSTKLGDVSDDGTTKQDYANSFCQTYEELAEKINDSGVLGEESGQLTSPYTYSTSSPDNDCY